MDARIRDCICVTFIREVFGKGLYEEKQDCKSICNNYSTVIADAYRNHKYKLHLCTKCEV